MNRAEVYVDFFKVFYDLADQRCRDYWGTPRPNGQAAGLESLCAFGGWATADCINRLQMNGHVLQPDKQGLQAATVVDAGAGASSAILRTYFPNVITCDPDGEYLAQVQRACARMGLPEGNWIVGKPPGPWDYCFYDYGTSVRGPQFPYFLDQTKVMIWIDDAHDRDLFKVCAKACEERHLKIHSHLPSLDEHDRFGAIVIKGGSAELVRLLLPLPNAMSRWDHNHGGAP